MKQIKKLKKLPTLVTTTFMTLLIHSTSFASGIGTAEVETATENIKRVITSIAMPLGGVLIFASIVVAAIKMITNANNPQKRAESIGSLAWICGRWSNFRCKLNYCRNYYKCCYKRY